MKKRNEGVKGKVWWTGKVKQAEKRTRRLSGTVFTVDCFNSKGNGDLERENGVFMKEREVKWVVRKRKKN